MPRIPEPKEPRLSAIIITKNEERNISECLASLTFCDEVIILDNGSADRTVSIGREAGANVIQTTEWLGYGPQKQMVLAHARGRWILSVDADERVSKGLAAEIRQVIFDDQDRGYFIERENYFLGKKMRFGGWSRDRVMRLAKRDRCYFSSDLVHESLICKDPINLLREPLRHFSYQSIDEVFEKQIRYAKLGALKVGAAGNGSNFPLLKAAWTFIRLYFVQFGFLDGWRGTLSAAAKSYETFWRYTLARRHH